MKYLFLKSFEPDMDVESERKKRTNSCESCVLNVEIEYSKDESLPLYFIFNNKSLRYIDAIRKNDIYLKEMADSLKKTSKDRFMFEMIVDEVYSSNRLDFIKCEREKIAKSYAEPSESISDEERLFFDEVAMYEKIREKKYEFPENPSDIRKIYDSAIGDHLDDAYVLDGKIFRNKKIPKNLIFKRVVEFGPDDERSIISSLENLFSFLRNSDILPIIKIGIAHFYFGYILPFYCGNGIISRLLTSYALADEYSFYTAVVFSKGAFSHSKAYSKIFDCAISKRNAGEMNIFVDEFLRFLYSGQMETIALLYEKLDRLESAKEIIKKDATVDSDFKKKAMSIFAEDYVFGYNFGLERGYIMDLCENFAFVTQMKRELEELEKAGKIIKIKGRPIVYRVSKNYFKDI